MKRAVAQLGETLSNRSSRSRFLGTVGKIALGIGAAAAGVGVATSALAGNCCNVLPPCPPPGPCPDGDTLDFADAYCCGTGSDIWTCVPCTKPDNTVACYYDIGPSSHCQLRKQ
jgi:hypothetical protein